MGIGVTIGSLLLLLLITLAALFIRLLHRRHSSSRRSWLADSRSQARRTHVGETV
ncbi:hypothetical protein [Streptomyces sp. NPDC023327]|uniref:hypothetical protein n=1 Tax=Streptomyces sp. NPDC023327 TaxID=3157088 RepID=UPI0033D063D4